MSASILNAIETITRETGYPPDAEELAAALGLSTRQIHSFLREDKRAGLVSYGDDDRLMLPDMEQENA